MVDRDTVDYRDSTPFDGSKLQSIDEISKAIRHKMYGVDTREAIAQQGEALVKLMQETGGNQSAEVAAARGNFELLGIREDAQDNAIVKAQSTANSKFDTSQAESYLKSITALPETFANLAEIKAKYPSGKNGLMVAADNGHKYIWTNSTWTDAGVYQSVGIADGSINPSKLSKDYNLITDAILQANNYIAGYNSTTLVPSLYASDTQSVATFALPKHGVVDVYYNASVVSQALMVLDKDNKTLKNLTSTQLASSANNWITPNTDYYTIDVDLLVKSYPLATKLMVSYMNADVGIFYAKAVGAYEPDDFAWLNVPGKTYTHPFWSDVNPTYTWDTNSGKAIPFLLNAIVDVKLFNADRSKKYALTIVRRNDDSNNITNFNVYQVTETALVSSFGLFYQTNYTPSSSIETLDLTSGQTGLAVGYITVNWDELPSGSLATSLGWNQAGLDNSVIIPDLRTQKISLLPLSKVYAVTNHEMNIYHDNLMYGDINNVEIYGVGNVGTKLADRLRINTATAGTYTYTLNIKDQNIDFPVIASTAITVKVANELTANSGVSKKVMFIGDSITDNNVYEPEVNALFGADSMNIELIGTRGSGTNLHEGRSGWGTSDYVYSQSFNGSTNAFFNPATSAFDFAYYVSQTNNIPDVVIVLLGTNDTWRSHAGKSSVDNLQFMVNSIKSYNSNIKIGIGLNTPPSLSDDAGGMVGKFEYAQGNRKQLVSIANNVFNGFVGKEADGIYIVPVISNIDTENNFQTKTESLNSRNDTQVKRVIDPIHPATSGYLQIADTMYAFLKNLAL